MWCARERGLSMCCLGSNREDGLAYGRCLLHWLCRCRYYSFW